MTVSLRGSRPVRRSNTKRGSRITRRPKRAAGIALRVDEAFLVKRLAIHPFGGRVTVRSDNPNYPDWPDRGLDELECIGRVIWAGRRIS